MLDQSTPIYVTKRQIDEFVTSLDTPFAPIYPIEREIALARGAAWLFSGHALPVGRALRATCKDTRCVNPSHMLLVAI